MTKSAAARRAARVAWGVVACACGGPSGSRPHVPAARATVDVGAGRPPVSAVEREGDGLGGIAIAVDTEGIAPDRGAVVAVALAALVEGRLAARGLGDTSVVGGSTGWRLRALVASPAEAAKLVGAAREAMLAPVTATDEGLAAVTRALAALARHPMADRALADVARCTGQALARGDEAAPTNADLEAWRRAAHGLGRVAIATAGDATFVSAVGAAVARASSWPAGASAVASEWPAADARAVVYDASGEVAPGAARMVVTAYTSSPERAVAAGETLGDTTGALSSRLAALDAPARLRSVVASAHADGGCVAATFDLAAADLKGAGGAARIATAAALARQELGVEVADLTVSPDLRRDLASHALDPRDAAERAAWWSLAGRHAGAEQVRTALAVGVATRRDTPSADAADHAAASNDALAAEIERAAAAWRTPVVEARTRVEAGQAETWVLVASTCGSMPESARDDGTGAAVAVAAATQDDDDDVVLEPFVATDGIGVVAHGPARADELPQAHARRLADLAGRAFAAEPLDADRLARARASLLARSSEADARAMASLGSVLAPGHPTWIAPLGTKAGLAAASDDAVTTRAAAMRAGPLRVAVLANDDAAQANAAVQAVDRWIARTPGEARSCPAPPKLPPVQPGTYAVDLTGKGPSEALLAFPLDAGDDKAHAPAAWIAAALDGAGGLLARALGPSGPGDAAKAGLARSWSASVVGPPHDAALVVRLRSDDASLDAAVAQTRALFDRLRQGALREEDRTRATAAIAKATSLASLDPHARVIRLWRGEGRPAKAPSLDVLRAFAAAALHDDALVIVALRPPRSDDHASKPARRDAGRR
ncbi:MAG TPA: hypothetical protein VGM06_13870 [Polyangiaceae bacterium]